MQLSTMGPLSISVFVSLLVAVALLAIRIVVMQRVQQRRQRENRQETERLKSMVAAYRSLAGSFSPPTGEHRGQMEEALSDVILFGSVDQVDMAAQCARALARGEPVPYQPLIESLRSDLRTQLGLEPIPTTINLPAAGPGRVNRGRGDGEGGAGGGGNRGGGAAGGGAGGGGGGGMAGAGGVGVGLIAGSGLDGGERQS